MRAQRAEVYDYFSGQRLSRPHYRVRLRRSGCTGAKLQGDIAVQRLLCWHGFNNSRRRSTIEDSSLHSILRANG